MNIILDKSTWKKVKFGDVVENTNRTIKKPTESGIDRFIGLEHLDSGDLRIKRFGNTEDGVTFTKFVSPGQTLFGKRRAYQKKVAFAEFNAVCSGDILAFSAKSELLAEEYLPFVVMSEGFFNRALSTSAGSLSPRTRWSDLAKFEFLLPPLDQQKEIADLFWKIEDHKTKLKQMNATLNNQIAPMFIKDKVTYNLGDEILETSLLNVGRWSSGMTPKAASPEYYLNGIYPFVTIGDLSSEIIIETSSYLTEAGLHHAGGLIKKGSILISMYGTIGKVAIAGVPLATSQAIASVLVDEKICLSRYIYYFLQSLKKEFEHEGRGATQMNINRKMITSKVIFVPTLERQAEIVHSLDLLNSEIQAVNDEILSLEKLARMILSTLIEVSN
jgi:type I restriction enzyme, S subunit